MSSSSRGGRFFNFHDIIGDVRHGNRVLPPKLTFASKTRGRLRVCCANWTPLGFARNWATTHKRITGGQTTSHWRKEERQRERSPIFHPSLFSHSLHQYSHHRRIEIYRLSNLDTPFAESIIPGQMWNTLNRPYNQYPSISHHRAFYFPSKLRPPEQHQGNLT